jgi:multifunctional beta-oxidation protein
VSRIQPTPLTSVGGQAVAAVGSVLDGQAIVDTAVKAFGTVHVLINNAGILRDKSFRKMTEQEFQQVYDIHIRGAFAITKACWPIFRKQKWGRIVNTSSPAGVYGNGGQTNYSGAKMGLVTFAQVLDKEGVKYNIKANTIAPVSVFWLVPH